MPRITAIIVLVVGVVLAAVLIRPGGEPAQASEVILQPTNAAGPDPFTPSTAKTTSSLPAAEPSTPPTETNAIRSVAGSEPGLYGGSRNIAACDVEKQIRYLSADRTKNQAFASALDIRDTAVPGYLRSLTSVQLRSDTRVTMHGYRDGAPTSYQAVLQAGTAVLVDDRGEPKVRCACGNPLSAAVAQKGTPEQKGTAWSGYRPQNVVVVNRAPAEVKEFVIFDHEDRDWVRRDSGDHGQRDEKTTPPDRHWPLPPANEPQDTKHDVDSPDQKDDPKKDDKKDDPKKDDKKEDPKKDDKKEDPKKDDKKEDPKKDDKKEDPKKDDKKEDPKKDDKKEDPKKDDKEKDPKKDDKKEDPKKDDKKEDPKKDDKKEDPKKDDKKEEPKKDDKKEEPKKEDKKPDPKPKPNPERDDDPAPVPKNPVEPDPFDPGTDPEPVDPAPVPNNPDDPGTDPDPFDPGTDPEPVDPAPVPNNPDDNPAPVPDPIPAPNVPAP